MNNGSETLCHVWTVAGRGYRLSSFIDAKPDSYDNVRLYISASGDADEIISAVRERLRAMNGVEVVYSSDEADLNVSLVTLKTRNKSAYETGYAISVVVTQPCMQKVGTQVSHLQTFQDQFVQVGSDEHVIVNSIVSSVDTDTIDDQRKENAEFKKMLQAQQGKN